jgi:hypothetical protein
VVCRTLEVSVPQLAQRVVAAVYDPTLAGSEAGWTLLRPVYVWRDEPMATGTSLRWL